MPISVEIAVLCALLAAGAFYVFKPMFSIAGTRPQATARKNMSTTQQNYRAASLACDALACQAAREMRGQKFLASEAPHLPLRDCDKGQCNCHLAFHNDRRGSNTERRSLQPSAADDERRASSGRRRTDWRLH